MSTTQPATANSTVEVFQFVRDSSKKINRQQIQRLIKNNLGFDSRQISVSVSKSLQYVTLTVRDASVDLDRVRCFRKSLDTWSMAQDDVVSGQSIEVRTTIEVDATHAAPFVDEAAQIAFELTQPGQIKVAKNGNFVICQGFDFIVQRGNCGQPLYAGSRDAAVSKSSFQLALAIARA
jgi:hypothetical protein